MTMVAQGAPGQEHVPSEPLPELVPWLGYSELGHVAHLLQKATSWLRSHAPADATHEIDSIADTDFRVPSDVPLHPEELRLEWIIEPARRHAVDVLLKSEAQPFVIRRGSSYFLMIRRRS